MKGITYISQLKRGRKKGIIYDPIEINLMLEKEKLKLI
jgi:hypothetical protein